MNKNTELDLFDLIEQEVIREKIEKEDQKYIDILHKKGINYTVFKNALAKDIILSEDDRITYYKMFAEAHTLTGMTLKEYTDNLNKIL